MPKYSAYPNAGALVATDELALSRAPGTAGTSYVTTPADITTYVNGQFDEFVTGLGFAGPIVGNELMPLVQSGTPLQSTPYDFMTYINAESKGTVSLLTDDFTYAATTAYLTDYSIQMSASNKAVNISGQVVPGQKITVTNKSWTLPTFRFNLNVGATFICSVYENDTVEILVGEANGGGLTFKAVNVYNPDPFNAGISINVTADYQETNLGMQSAVLNPNASGWKYALPNFSVNSFNVYPAKNLYVYNSNSTNSVDIYTYGNGLKIITIPPGVACFIQIYNNSGPVWKVIPIPGYTITVTGTTYTTLASDVLGVVQFTNAAGCAVTITPGNHSSGDVCQYINLGAGVVTFGGTYTPSIAGTNKLAQYARGQTFKTSTGVEILTGELTS